MNVDAALSYLDFVAARHEVFVARQLGKPQPWTDNEIVATRKFTNIFRVLDYGSQFVLTDLIDPELEPEDQLMRLFLYRHTGRVETWEYIDVMLGRYPLRGDLDDVLEILKEYRGEFKTITSGNSTRGKPSRKGRIPARPVFTSAYLVFPQSDTPGTDKLESIIDLTRRLFVEGKAAEAFLASSTQQGRFNALRSNKGVADFMSMQILTDWGYTPHCGEDRENAFVVAGPGARKGALALGFTDPMKAILWAHAQIQDLRVVTGDGHFEFIRPPSWMDAQNTLCEFSKYVRYEEKPAPGKLYTPAHPGPQQIVLPEHWSTGERNQQ